MVQRVHRRARLPANPAPLDAITDDADAGPGDEDWCIRRCTELALERGIGRKEAPDQGMAFFRCVNQCMGSNDYPGNGGRTFRQLKHSESQSLLSSSLPHLQTISPWWVVISLFTVCSCCTLTKGADRHVTDNWKYHLRGFTND